MELVRYESAKQAIAEYKTVDEVKDFRDKALAVEAYAKQANDFSLERDAAIARVRAERRCGQLLSEMEKAKGARGNASNQYQKEVQSNDATAPRTLAEMGVTKDQSSKWQKLAAIPDDEFERAVDVPGSKPTTSHLLNKNEQPEQMDKDALWLWGRLLDWEKVAKHKTLEFLLDQMTDAMRSDAERIIPKLKKWVTTNE